MKTHPLSPRVSIAITLLALVLVVIGATTLEINPRPIAIPPLVAGFAIFALLFWDSKCARVEADN